MRNIGTAVRGHCDDDGYMWAIIIRRFYDRGRVGHRECRAQVQRVHRLDWRPNTHVGTLGSLICMVLVYLFNVKD
jgi:hypothetical protein